MVSFVQPPVNAARASREDGRGWFPLDPIHVDPDRDDPLHFQRGAPRPPPWPHRPTRRSVRHENAVADPLRRRSRRGGLGHRRAGDGVLPADPEPGLARSPRRRDFRVLFDEGALYIGARLYDAHPESIQANLGRRDASLPADRISVYIDPYHDKRSGYLFVVNAAGLRSTA